MNSTLKIGTIGFPVTKKMLYPYVEVVELTDTRLTVPKTAAAKKLRSEAPSHVSFALQMPKYFFEKPPKETSLGGDPEGYGDFKVTNENRHLFERLNRYAEAVKADTLVLITPSEFTPTTHNRAALETFLREMPLEDRTVVWQPSGPWTEEQSAGYAEKLGMVLAVDPLRDDAPKGDSAYFRLGPFAAMGSRVGLYDLERLLDAAGAHNKTTIVFETDRALDDVKNLKQLKAELE